MPKNLAFLLNYMKTGKHPLPKKIMLGSLGLLAGLFILLAGIIVIDGLTDHVAPADVAIVLGNKVNPDGQPSPRLQARLDKTVELYRQGLFVHIFVSGGVGAEGYDEAAVMKAYLITQGVPENVITTDNQGNDTYQTARNATHWMEGQGYQSALVITQYFHISRARLALERFGVEEVYSAHAVLFEWRDLYSVPREVVAWLTYCFRKYE